MTDPAFRGRIFDRLPAASGPVTVTVTQYAARIAQAVATVGPAVIEGEVQRPRRAAGGSFWFTLTDGQATLGCKVFRAAAQRLEHVPCEGDVVQVEVDRPDLWVASGKLDLIVSQIRLAGEGELLRRRLELLDRLTGEGLCDLARRRPLPAFPAAVGVIAGAGSDAMSDVLRALHDRWPAAPIVACPATVQGARAPGDIIDALARLQARPEVEVIIVARGGGSVRDLACFDDERLCRALFACPTPVITAIGHTDNVPVCSHVAHNATTPSRSAEMAVPSIATVRSDITAFAGVADAVPAGLNLAGERVRAVRLDLAGRLQLLIERTRLRTDSAAGLSARRAAVAEQARDACSTVERFIAHHQVALRDLRGVLAAAPLRASRTLAAQRDDVARHTACLQAATRHLDDLHRDVPRLGQQVHAGTCRQLTDHARDYGRAAARLTTEARAGLERDAARACEQIAHHGNLIGQRARVRLDAAGRDTRHAAELIAARDFRRNGWVLTSTADQPVHSAGQLNDGQTLTLDFHDGRAKATVNEHTTNNQEQHHEHVRNH
jgi:exodeoxyribonuclease VII large subunit